MWKYQWTRNESPLTEELKNVLYDESQGIMDIAVKLYSMAQVKAIADGTETVAAATIREAAAEKLRLVKPMLDALRSGDMKKIMRYEDIAPVNIENYIAAQAARIPAYGADRQAVTSLEEQASGDGHPFQNCEAVREEGHFRDKIGTAAFKTGSEGIQAGAGHGR